MDDPKVYDLFAKGLTVGVFQFESSGMRDFLKKLKPTGIEGLIAMNALYRPGPMQNIDRYIKRSHGEEKVEYVHPLLEEALKETHGIIVYQEQVMQIAQVLAGYSLGGADMLRRAMGKKKPEEMAKQRGTFKEGAIANGVDGELSMKIFDLVEKFAGYGFNKSHSAAYALVSYQTLWMKTHFPAPFMAAVMSADMDNTDKVLRYIHDCHEMKITVQPPNVNLSDRDFSVYENKISYLFCSRISCWL